MICPIMSAGRRGTKSCEKKLCAWWVFNEYGGGVCVVIALYDTLKTKKEPQ